MTTPTFAPWKLDDGTQIYLLHINALDAVPDGTTLIDIGGQTVIKGVDPISRDHRFGYSAYGLLPG